MTKASTIIQKHYGMTRKVTPDEVRGEIANIYRRMDAGTLDDQYERLASKLGLFSIGRVKGQS